MCLLKGHDFPVLNKVSLACHIFKAQETLKLEDWNPVLKYGHALLDIM